jgi:xylulose-5-phosphate/fructose-6-phosphate phosphoketolase
VNKILTKSRPRISGLATAKLATTRRPPALVDGPLDADLLPKMDAWWRAANYLSVGQTYLYDNPLLNKPLKKEHVKPRLVGGEGALATIPLPLDTSEREGLSRSASILRGLWNH